MRLEDEQWDLLVRFVEAHRNAPAGARAAFIASQAMGQSQASFLHIMVPSLHFQGSVADAEVLADFGLLRLSHNSQGDRLFYMMPAGIEFYQAGKLVSPPVASVENDIRQFLAAPKVRECHPSACAKWEQAVALLWAADSTQQLTTIGHLCREALQEFTESLAGQHKVDVSTIQPSKTVTRLKAVLAARASDVGTTESAFLDALVSYWGAAADLAQRQEHGSQREGTALVWEDARRVVFQTVVVMYEVARALP
jgi:hypothetical protein